MHTGDFALDFRRWKRFGTSRKDAFASDGSMPAESKLRDRCWLLGTVSKPVCESVDDWCKYWEALWASSLISSNDAERTCLGTSRLLCVFIYAPMWNVVRMVRKSMFIVPRGQYCASSPLTSLHDYIFPLIIHCIVNKIIEYICYLSGFEEKGRRKQK